MKPAAFLKPYPVHPPDCECHPIVIDADSRGERVSLVLPALLTLNVNASDAKSSKRRCELAAEVLEASNSEGGQGHRFKVQPVHMTQGAFLGFPYSSI